MSALWGERTFVEVKIAMEAGVGREPVLATRRSEKIQSSFGLRQEEVPFHDQKLGIVGGKAHAEVVLPDLDGALYGIAPMANMGRYSLEVDVIFADRLFKFFRTFVISNMQGGSEAVGWLFLV